MNIVQETVKTETHECMDMTHVVKRDANRNPLADKYGQKIYSNVKMSSFTEKKIPYYLVEADGMSPKWMTKPEMRLMFGGRAVAQAMEAFTRSNRG